MDLGTIAAVISILGAGKSAYDFITGTTVSKKLLRLFERSQRLDKHIFYQSTQEVRDATLSRQRLVTDLAKIRSVAEPVQKALNAEVLLSTPIFSPMRLKKAFEWNPEEVLFGITPLRGDDLPGVYLKDPTLVPVTFSRWGQEFIGFLKVGYARDYLDLEYKPQFRNQGEIVVPTKSLLKDKVWAGRIKRDVNLKGVILDSGALKAIQQGANLLPIGIVSVVGRFKRGSQIHILDSNGIPVAKGVSVYSSREIERIKGCHSRLIETILGTYRGPSVVHAESITEDRA